MNVDFAFICDYAEAKEKINAMGIGFDTIYATQLPVKHARFYIVAQLRFGFSETGTHKLEIRLIDADGKDAIRPVQGQIEVNPPPAGKFENTARFTMAFDNIEFKAFGDYSVQIRLDDKEYVSIPLKIAEAPKTTNRAA
jgi:hypothetical protein